MTTLTLQRCLHHAGREAVARCPECGGFFCRECITEHDDRVLCADCLAKLTAAKPAERKSRELPLLVTRALLGFLAAWLIFYSVGRMLLASPESFHNGSLWEHPQGGSGD